MPPDVPKGVTDESVCSVKFVGAVAVVFKLGPDNAEQVCPAFV